MTFRFMLLAAVALVPASAVAGFSIEGFPTLSTEQGEMGRHAPTTDRGRAAFHPQQAEKASPQKRFENAELLVDLAYSPLTETGAGDADLVDGFADEIPFAEAMTLVLPSGWQLYKNKNLPQGDVPKTISFTGGKPWPEVLKTIGERNALHFHVDWYQRTIEMTKGRETYASQRIKVIPEPAPVRPKPAPVVAATPKEAAKPVVAAATAVPAADKPIEAKAEPAKTAAAPAAADAAAKAKPAAPAPVLPREVRLVVRPGLLSDNLIRLSKENGWEVPDWRIEDADYSIRNGYTITGKDFTEAISKLLLLHPVEAEVNTSTRKVTVIKEAR